ncbi:MAG: hypothetical protein MJZ74_07475 [Muribaculaceae bacterium]|nr:hypothetical protein [Muribaculaceae bacterium]
MKRALQLMIVLMMGLSFSSCEFHEPYYDAPFLGAWESIQYGEGNYEYDLRLGEYHRYTFYRDGTGAYVQEDGLRTRFYWDEYGRDRLELRHDDGLRETLYYDFDGPYMLLSTRSNFYTYYLYRRY